MKCGMCGSTALVEGTLFDKSYVSEIGFKAANASLLTQMFGVGILPVRAYGCARCGHLQMVVVLSEQMREQHRQFEGQQPSLMERLSDEGDERKE